MALQSVKKYEMANSKHHSPLRNIVDEQQEYYNPLVNTGWKTRKLKY